MVGKCPWPCLSWRIRPETNTISVRNGNWKMENVFSKRRLSVSYLLERYFSWIACVSLFPQIHQSLQAAGIKAGIYHGQMDNRSREESHRCLSRLNLLVIPNFHFVWPASCMLVHARERKGRKISNNYSSYFEWNKYVLTCPSLCASLTSLFDVDLI